MLLKIVICSNLPFTCHVMNVMFHTFIFTIGMENSMLCVVLNKIVKKWLKRRLGKMSTEKVKYNMRIQEDIKMMFLFYSTVGTVYAGRTAA